jgi:hypothetical protein
LDQGKRYPERFERRVIRICMGNNELSDGVWLGRVRDILDRLINWWGSWGCGKGEAMSPHRFPFWGGSIVWNTLQKPAFLWNMVLTMVLNNDRKETEIALQIRKLWIRWGKLFHIFLWVIYICPFVLVDGIRRFFSYRDCSVFLWRTVPSISMGSPRAVP